MTIPLFSGDAGRSLFIRKGTDSYGEEGRRQEAEGCSCSVGNWRSYANRLTLIASLHIRDLGWGLNLCSFWSQQKAECSIPPAFALEPPVFLDKINNLVGLIGGNLQPALSKSAQ